MGFKEREGNRNTGVVAAIAGTEPTKKVGRPKLDKEIMQRKTITILPSIWSDMQKIAFVDRTSVSELISKLTSDYIQKNKLKLDEYEELKK